MEIASADLAEVRERYGQGLYLQAYQLSQAFGPLPQWQGTAAMLLGGRIAIQLGAQRLGRWLHLRAFRGSPSYPEAIYYHARYRLEKYGPLATWEFLRKNSDWTDVAPELRADWFAFHGFVAARMRDFDRAERWLNRAESLTPHKPWLCIERSAFLEFAERYDEAMDSARRSLELQPWFRPGVQAVAHLLHVQRKTSEAVDLLTEAGRQLESGIVIAQLAGLQMELGRHHDARQSYDRYAELSPLMEKDARKWLNSRRADVAFFLGDRETARLAAAELDDPYYPAFAKRLADPDSPRGRVLLPLSIGTDPNAILTPVPPNALTLIQSMVRFWERPEPLPKWPDHYPFDGLPDYHERQWLEANGWVAREFCVTRASGQALLDRGVPFLMNSVEAGYSHPQVVVGYDLEREVFLLADVLGRPATEAMLTSIIDRYLAQGPRGLVFVPADKAHLLDGIDLPEVANYTHLHEIQIALSEHRRDEAGHILSHMPTGERLTKMARLALMRYDARPTDILAAIDDLIASYPKDSTFQLGKLGMLRELGRTKERTALLRELCKDPEADPMYLQHLAQALLPDVRERDRTRRLLVRAIRRRPYAAAAYYLMGNRLWEEGDFPAATDAHRFASALDEREDQFCESYFRAARACDQLPEAMRFLQTRFQKMKTKLAAPARALFFALSEQEEIASAFEMLDQGIRARPDDGELILFAAEMRSSYDEPDLARELVARAQPITPPNVWRRSVARIAAQEIRLHDALPLWQEVLASEPMAIDAYRNITRLTAETQGRAAAMKWLRDEAAKRPFAYAIWQLAIDWHRGEVDVDSEPLIRHLLEISPTDAWVRRELALYLGNLQRVDEAVAELELSREDEPESPSYYYSLGHVLHKADRIAESRAVYEEAIRLSVDHEVAVNEIVGLLRGQNEKIEMLRWIGQQLRTQHHFGEGLMAFRDQAIQVLEPDELHRVLDDVLEQHPEMWQAWSLNIQQLGMMGRTEEALALAREAVSRFPLLARLWLDLAEVHQAKGDVEGQIEALRMTLQVAPGWGAASRELSDVLEANQQPDDARAVLEQAIARTPLDPVNHGYLAEMLWNNGDGDEAIRRVHLALRIDPGYEWAWRTLGDWSQRNDTPERIIEVAREVAHIRSGDPRAWLALARVLNGREFAEEAIHALDRAIALNPRSIEAYDLKAERLTEMGRFDEAKAAASPELFLADPPLTLQGRLAWIEARRGNYAGAIPPMQALVAIEPTYYWGWQQLAEWHNETNRPEEYLQAANELVRLRPESPVALAMRGEARIQNNEREEGKADLRQAQQLAPTYAFAGMLLFDAHFADKEFREARAVLAVLQEHLGGPFVFARHAQLAASERDREQALDALRNVCASPTDGAWPVQTSIGALRSAGWSDDVDAVLKEAWEGDEPFHPWVAIAWVESPTGQRADADERMRALRRAIERNPRFVQGYDYLAEILARMGRFEEAIKTCRATVWGERVPLLLRGREAWIIGMSDRNRAIQQMQAILNEDSDYLWGWQQLARWHDLNDSHREYLHAAENLVRLSSSDPVSYSHRGEARRNLGDHTGALEDFARAFKLDPEYAFAGLRLLDEQLAADQLDAAEQTLSQLQEHVGGPYVASGAVQLAVRRKDQPSAIEAFRDLATDDEANYTLLNKALGMILESGWQTGIEQTLSELVEAPGTHPMVGRLWVERLVARDDWSFVDRLPTLIEKGNVGREALLTYIDLLGTPARATRLPEAIQRFADTLRETDRGWAKVGAALVTVRNYTLAAEWQADWRNHEDADPWMLHPYARALRALGRFDEAHEVSQEALEAIEEDATTADHEVWLALDYALKGDHESASDMLDSVDPIKLDDAFRLLQSLAEALLTVQEAEAGGKARAFQEAREQIETAIGAVKAADLDDGFDLTYKRVVARLAADAGTLKAKMWAFWQRLFPNRPRAK